jgi:predicted Zn-dependent protease
MGNIYRQEIETKSFKSIKMEDVLNKYTVKLGLKIPLFIINDPSLNAHAYVGNFISINSGLIKTATNNEEILGVLAHEAGHLMLLHPQKSLSSGLILTFILPIIKNTFGINNNELEGITTTLLLTKFSREQEDEADSWALDQLYKKRISAKGFESFMQRIGDSTVFFKYLNTHPLTQERMTKIKSHPAYSIPLIGRNLELLKLKNEIK